MDIKNLPFEEALDLYYELVHAIEKDDEETIKELNLIYPSLFQEEVLQSLAETAEEMQRMTQYHNIPLLPETNSRKLRINIQLDRINRLVRENPEFFNDNPNSDALYIELAIDKLEEIINTGKYFNIIRKDDSGKIIPFKPRSKR